MLQRLAQSFADLVDRNPSPRATTRESECLDVEDGLPDVPVVREAGVGIGVAVADALREVRERADAVRNASGGRGAVREGIVRLMELRAPGRLRPPATPTPSERRPAPLRGL